MFLASLTPLEMVEISLDFTVCPWPGVGETVPATSGFAVGDSRTLRPLGLRALWGLGLLKRSPLSTEDERDGKPLKQADTAGTLLLAASVWQRGVRVRALQRRSRGPLLRHGSCSQLISLLKMEKLCSSKRIYA